VTAVRKCESAKVRKEGGMDTVEAAVVVGAGVLIVGVLWYFFGGRR
jgi:hypothetical protein